MNILYYNIKGGGSSIKKKIINYLINSGNIDIFFLQETKMTYFDDGMARSF